MGIMRFLCEGHEDYMMTSLRLQFLYALRKVLSGLSQKEKSHGDRRKCNHIRRSLKPPRMSEKSYGKRSTNKSYDGCGKCN